MDSLLKKLITFFIGVGFILFQWFKCPFEECVLYFRENMGIFGWFTLTPLIFGIGLIIISLNIKQEKKDP